MVKGRWMSFGLHPVVPLGVFALIVVCWAVSVAGGRSSGDNILPDQERGGSSPAGAASGTESVTRGSPLERSADAVDEPGPHPVGREKRLDEELSYDARAFATALLTGDGDTVASLLARRCAGRDPRDVVAARRAAITRETGESWEALAASAPLIVHFDAGSGEAHAFLGLVSRGKRLTGAAPDGWVYEDGRWRNVEC